MPNYPWGGPGSASVTEQSTTAAQLTYDALRDLGVLRVGQGAAPEWDDDGLRALNQILDSWNTERLNIHAMSRSVYSLAATEAQESFFGDDGNRPTKIERVTYLRSGSTTETPINLLGVQQWVDGWDGVYVDGEWPLPTLRLRPTPSSGDQLVVYAWRSLVLFADADTAYGFPPGYAQALRYALGVALAPSAMAHTKIPRPLLESIERQAIEAKARIKRLNLAAHPITLKVDEALTQGSRFNVLTGGY